MSQQAQYRAQSTANAVVGNTARTLSGSASPLQAPQPRRRTPLVLVPARISKRRTPFVVFCFFTLVAALGSVLVLNVSVSSGQYRLVELNDEKVALAQENEMLTQLLKNREAPQNLAAAAAELGMVASPSFGTIDLQSGKISGDPEAAKETDGPEALIPAPDVAISPQVDGPVSGEAGAAAESLPESSRSSAAAGETATADDQPNAGDEAGADESKPDELKPEAPEPEAPKPNQEAAPVEPAPVDLNGGTIPAPQQQTGE